MNRFDAMSKNFDTNPRVKRALAVADEIRRHINDGAKKTAIEYGCGTGLVGLALTDDFSAITFVDSSAGMIDELKKKISSGDGRLSAMCCDLMSEAPSGFRADYIFMSLVLHHIQDTEHALSVFYNLLNEGGHLLVIDLDTEDGGFHAEYPDFDGHNGYDQAELSVLAKQAGFRITSSYTFYHDIKNAGGIKAPYSLFILDAEK